MNLRQINWKRVAYIAYNTALVSIIGASFIEPAFAQLSNVTNTMQQVATVTKAAGVSIGAIGCSYAGGKCYFGDHSWKDVKNIVWGSTLFGGSTTIVGTVMGWAS